MKSMFQAFWLCMFSESYKEIENNSFVSTPPRFSVEKQEKHPKWTLFVVPQRHYLDVARKPNVVTLLDELFL